MIPLRLQLQNFMSYGEGVPPLAFGGIRLACLSGDNGNGKSALLDAMTWALFGRTRAKAEDDVIRIGAAECQVFFDFEVGGTRYRVKRQRARSGGGYWQLEVFQDDGTPRSLTGNTVHETRERLRNLLRMDYETFLATCYLAQGQADVFARSGPTDRKKILADILDLSRYDRLEEKAKERYRDADGREGDAGRRLVQIDAELEREDEHRAQLAEAERALGTLSAERESLMASLETARARCERSEAEAEKARDLEERIRDNQAQVAAYERDKARLDRRIAEAEALAARRVQILAAAEECARLQNRLRALNAQNAEAMALQREKEQLQGTLRDAREQLDRARFAADRDILEIEKYAVERERLDGEIVRLSAEISGYGDLAARLADADAVRQCAEDALQELKVQHAGTKAREAALLTRRAALAEADAPECNYCGQPLSPKARAAALSATESELDEVAQALARLAADGREARRTSDAARAAVEAVRKEQDAAREIDARRRHAEQERLRLVEREKELPDLRRRRDRLSGQLDRKDYCRPEQERLVQVSAQVEKLERVGEELTRLDAELARYAGVAQDMVRLEQADEVLAHDPPRAAELAADIHKKSGQIEKALAQVAAIRERITDLPALQRARSDAEARVRDADAEAQRANRRIGDLTSQLERLAGLRDERSRYEAERAAAVRDKELYRELVGAFGKKGVQALIIENALPEIQDETNALLHRMTSGAMTVKFESQRQARTRGGGAIETLDIILADDAGTRPYEMYSGGEAFRVSLALRVALSKTLSRRAGAPLQTLILDEGFGTQDPRGREAIAEALEAISSDFALVLVITHIEELKDRFPTRIEVVKNATGSTFSIVE